MLLEGTIQNGALVPDDGAALPDGARVRYELLAADDEEDLGPPPDTETRAEFLASLRESVAESRAGVSGIPLDEAMTLIAAEFKLPWPATER